MRDPASSWLKYLSHRMFLKHDVAEDDMKTDLRRCLSTWQLTLLGLGSTIGVGIYVLLGVMAKEEAGPSVIVSFLIATVVTLMNALVYAEFSTYVPHTGAAYIYLYKVFGEFAAFLVGSINIASGLFSSSVGARAWSGMLDSFFNNTIQESKNPAKSIPRAMIGELTIVGLVYIGAAVGMMFLIPYWLIDLRAPLPSAFEYSGLLWGKVIVTIGPMFGITNLQLLSVYGLSRNIYRMSKDGLFFSFFVSVNKQTGVPVRAAVFVGIFTSCFSLLCDLSYVVKMSVALMLICYLSVGPALICLKIKESNKSMEFSLLPNKEDNVVSLEQNEEVLSHGEFANTEGNCSQHSDVQDGLLKTQLAKVNKENVETPSSDFLETTVSENNSQGLATIVAEVNNTHRVTRALTFGSGDEIERENCLLENHIESKQEDHVTLNSLNIPTEECQSTLEVTFPPHDEEKASSFTATSLECETTPQVNQVQNGSLLHSTLEQTTSSNLNTDESAVEMFSRPQATSWLLPLVPGVLSSNMLVLLHLITCVTLSALIIYGQANLVALRAVAIMACGTLIGFLLLFSFLLWVLCAHSGRQNKGNFQTPLMPLIPTLSIFLSSMMLFSAVGKDGVIETVVMVVGATVVYVLMMYVKFQSLQQSKGPAGTAQSGQECEEQAMLLMSPNGETEADEEEESVTH
ncbi:cationic amino acid transporter 2 [Plakobranchus ocellatus]|uniref:Cationic amino acid transporter 2 n=1 Tax=Plakobranchus ocellatus TaxID=259542 RepID=A0AAV3Z8C4_9GAST|nr:cationic amino acid transporter 2 [Plakobranchus ocellatus]